MGPESKDKGSYKREEREDTAEENTQSGRPCEVTGRDGSLAATSQRTPGAARSWKRKKKINLRK